MRCRIKYIHPTTGNIYYFVDFRTDGEKLRPIGCLPYHRQNGTVFQTKREALKVSEYLVSLGYIRVFIVRYR